MKNIIAAFEREVLHDCSEYTSLRQLARYLKSPEAAVIIIYDDLDQICAYAIGTIRHFKKPSGHILKIAVRKDMRHRGLGIQLLSIMEAYFSHKSMKKIYAEARKSNIASLNLFEKAGYKNSGTLFGYYGCQNEDFNLEDGIKLIKDLN